MSVRDSIRISGNRASTPAVISSEHHSSHHLRAHGTHGTASSSAQPGPGTTRNGQSAATRVHHRPSGARRARVQNSAASPVLTAAHTTTQATSSGEFTIPTHGHSPARFSTP